MFVSMMEHRSPERRVRVSGNRAHNNNLHKHYLNRHHQQIQQQSALTDTKNFLSKTQNFPVLQIENHLQNKSKAANIHTPIKQVLNESQHSKDSLYLKKSAQDRKILTQKNILDEIELKRKVNNTKISITKEHTYRQRNGYSREPYDCLNNICNDLNDKKSNFSKIKEQKQFINIFDNNQIVKKNRDNPISNSSSVDFNNNFFENNVKTSNSAKNKINISYQASDLQKSLSNKELLKCKNSFKNQLNFNYCNDPCCSSVYASFPTLLDEVELKYARRSNSKIKQQKHDFRDKSLPYTVYNKQYNNDCNFDLNLISESNPSMLNVSNVKKFEKKIEKPKTSLDILEKNLKCFKYYSDDSDLERKTLETVNSIGKKLNKNTNFNNKKSYNFLKQSLNNNNVVNNLIKDDALIRSDIKLKSNNNRMSASVIHMQQYKSPINSTMPLFIHFNKNEVLIEDNNDNNNTSLALKNTSSSLNNVSLLKLNENVQNTAKSLIIDRRDCAQLYKDFKNDSPEILRRRKVSSHFSNNNSNNLVRSKSQTRDNVNNSTNLKKNLYEAKNLFLINRSKTSINFTPLSSKTNHLNLKTNLNKSIKRTRLFSNDQSIILSLFNPIENDRQRTILRDNARILSCDKIGFEIAQQELRAFNHFKELGLGKTRVLKIADLPNIELLHSIQVLKKYRNLQRPKKKALHEYYNDDDAELEGFFKIII